jgi:dephospho-CoA kinase
MLDKNHHVWIIVGYTGVGKTILANMLIEKINVKVLSFRKIVKDFCQQIGYMGVRNYFGSVTELQFINNIDDCVLSEINRMLECSADLIVEGLPSISVIENLRSRMDVTTNVIYLEASAEIRENRVFQRSVITSEDAKSEEFTKNQFKISLGLEKVIASADYVVDATRKPNEILDDLISVICPQSFKGRDNLI